MGLHGLGNPYLASRSAQIGIFSAIQGVDINLFPTGGAAQPPYDIVTAFGALCSTNFHPDDVPADETDLTFDREFVWNTIASDSLTYGLSNIGPDGDVNCLQGEVR